MSGTKNLPDFDLDLALEGVAMRRDTREMESLIKSLGEQIKMTKESMQKDWQSFTDEAQISLETSVDSIKDFAQYFQDHVELEGHSCSSEPINLNVFLNNVVQALERNLGQEEKILDELTNFAFKEGFVLPAPFPDSNDDDYRRSTASLNVVISENEETTSTLWERIRKMTSRGLLAAIDKLSFTQDKKDAEVVFAKKVKLLEKMCMLYVPSDVWKKYLTLRSQQIARFLQNPANLDSFQIQLDSTSGENLPGEATRLVRVSHALGAIMQEDYMIAELGMFSEAFQMQPEEVFSVYLSGFKRELGEVVKHLHTLGRRGSVKLGDCSGNTLSSKIFLAFRQCLLAASLVDDSAKKFLRSLQSFFGKKDTLESTFGSTFSISSTPVESSSTTEAEVLPGEVVRDEPEPNKEEEMWYWQEAFKPVASKLALAIADNIQAAARVALETEMKEYEESRKYEAVKVADKLADDVMDYPKQITKSCSLIMGKTDELLPFLRLRSGKEFETVSNLFMESLTTVLMTYQSRLTQMSSDVPRRSQIRNLCLALNSAIFVQNTLKRYEDDYGEITGSLSAVYCDLVESLFEKVRSYHYTTIATVILQDAQSHHWMNQKEFFEGERCSFSVQMWNYYMQGVQHDLWEMCPPGKAKEIFTSILQYSLSCFVRRYSKVIPTYKRTKLLRWDITSLLFSISSSMIFSMSSSSTDIFNPDPTRNSVVEIHNSCSALLAIMAIISCPLEVLVLFSAGGAEKLINDGAATGTSWLSWLQPELYGEHCKSLLSLSDIQAVNIYFKLTMSQPQPVWELILQTLLLRDAYLAVTIVTYLESCQIHLHHEDESDTLSQRKRSVQFRSQCQVLTDNNEQDSCSGIVGSLYYVILKCCKRSRPLVNFVIALMNRENSWQIFTSTEGLRLGDEDKIPVWFDCIYSTCKPYLRRLTILAASGLCTQQQPTSNPFKFTAMKSLPCGCQVTKPTSTGRKKDETELLYEAFEKVLLTLTTTLRFLPRILFKVFIRIEDDLRQLKLTSEDTPSAGIKLLGSMVFRSFSAICVEDVPEGFYCEHDIVNECMLLGQLIYHVMVGELEGFLENAGLPIALETIIKNKKNWILDQVRRISDTMLEMNEDESLTDSGHDTFSELQYGLLVKKLFIDSKGKKALNQVYNFFQAKKDWIVCRIPLVSHLGSLQQPSTRPRKDRSLFNPLHAYNSLGDYSFDHNAIEDFPFDWEQMFRSNIGMSLKSFKRLVFNRYELQNEKDVEEDKIELVEKLKAFYDRESEAV